MDIRGLILQQAENLEISGNLQAAQLMYRRVLEQFPETFEAGLRLGSLLCRLGQQDEGVAWLHKSCSLAPEDPITWYHLGVALANSGSFEEAIDAFQTTVSLNPEFIEGWNGMAVAHLKHGNGVEGKNAFQHATKLIKENPELYRAPPIKIIRTDVWQEDSSPKILLLKLDHIGDMVTSLHAFRRIRTTWPKAEITLVCGSWNVEFAERMELFDRVVSFDYLPKPTERLDPSTLSDKLHRFHQLSLGSFDIAVDFRWYNETRWLLNLVDAKYRAGFDAAGDVTANMEVVLPVARDAGRLAQNGARAAALAEAVIATFGVGTGGTAEMLMGGRPPVRAFSEGPIIGIHIGIGNPIRDWGRERFCQLARLLHQETGCKVVLLGSPAEVEDANFIEASYPEAEWANLAGRFSVSELPPVLSGLDLFIGHDTGTTHLAAALGVPTICIYGGVSHVYSWRPLGPKVVTVFAAVECHGCALADGKDCPRDRLCMHIPPENVASEAVSLLSDAIQK